MSKLGLSKVSKDLQPLKDRMLDAMAENTIKFFSIDNFNAQGFQNRALVPWAPRKDKKDTGRQLLVKTGRLKNSCRVTSRTKNSRTVEFTAPYAGFINDGTKNMPARQLVGESEILNRKTEKIISDYLISLAR
jgi:hypothetical protein